jgi:hypothetical protein
MASRLSWILAELAAVSFLLTALWLAGGQAAYESFFAEAARGVLDALGLSAVPDSPARRRFVSYVPFLALMVATPGLAWRRRLGGVLLGIPLIFLGHVALVAVEALSHTRHRPTADSFTLVFPAAMLCDALPFALWAIFASDALRGLFAGGGRGGAAGPRAKD